MVLLLRDVVLYEGVDSGVVLSHARLKNSNRVYMGVIEGNKGIDHTRGIQASWKQKWAPLHNRV